MKAPLRFLLGAAMVAAASTEGAAAPAHRMIHVPAGIYRPMYARGEGVRIGAFSLDRDPVTRGEYLAWSGSKARLGDIESRRPMTEVSWAEAGAFCKARGDRLPTLAEWEYAASKSDMSAVLAAYSLRSATPPTVDHGTPNAIGVRGMHDLVWEWVADPNDRITALHHAGMHHDHAKAEAHDMSCAGAAIGASDPRDYPAFLRGAIRAGLTETTRLPTLGFRCAS
jgi:formylglycine-generating enzyme required for sulfatase activity